MSLDRRQFLAIGGALALAGRHTPARAETPPQGAGALLPGSVRDDFPSVGDRLELNAAAQHPLGRFTADRQTRLVSMALVSHVNGFMHDAAAVSAIAHDRGAYLFADIVQAVGAVPVDVRALGIDFASTGTYKWLMGERGFGFLYVKKDLQETVVPTPRYGHRQITNFNRRELTWEPLPGAAKYETGGIGSLLATAVDAGIGYIDRIGVPRIRAHAQQLTTRLQEALPALGYPSLTPPATATPIVAFELTDVAAAQAALQNHHVAATIIPDENRLRLSVSVFNTHRDVDRVIDLLGRRRMTRL